MSCDSKPSLPSESQADDLCECDLCDCGDNRGVWGTVTGAGPGNYGWCDQSWLLPDESGVTKCMCPTTWSTGRGCATWTVGPYSYGGHTYVSYNRTCGAGENWSHWRQNLVLARFYSFVLWKFWIDGSLVYSGSHCFGVNYESIFGGDNTNERGWYTGNGCPPFTTVNTGGAMPVPGPPATYGSYSIGILGGSYVRNGVTYSWVPAMRW